LVKDFKSKKLSSGRKQKNSSGPAIRKYSNKTSFAIFIEAVIYYDIGINSLSVNGVFMKGIILAGGAGSRLYPLSEVMSKQLMPVYDKPMIYYPLSTLMLGGIRDILVISTPQDTPKFEALLGNGNQWGISLQYQVQEKPEGIAQAFILGKQFIGKDNVTLILGDNIFYGKMDLEEKIASFTRGALIFGYYVRDPERYGVLVLDEEGRLTKIEEKPKVPVSNFAVPGLYVYDNKVVEIAESLKPSDRGELEISEVNLRYLEVGELRFDILGRGIAWLDTGTHASLLDAANFIYTLEARQGLKIACLEEIAFTRGFIIREQFEELVNSMTESPYKKYLKSRFLDKKDPAQGSLLLDPKQDD
jgi:glucose-1-phosphate thymidylyltransferase